MEKVLITGGSGLIGGALTKLLQQEGYEVVHLSRSKNSKHGVTTFVWDLKNKTIENGALRDVNYIVHLAGAGVSDKQWTYKYRKTIVKSRIDGIPLLLEAAKKESANLKAFISASGVNYYGSQSILKDLSEDTPPGDDFLAKTCVYWENYADKFLEITRVVKLRTGIVLDKAQGALPRLAEPIKYNFGAALGSGKQYMPWAHIEDIAGMYLFAIQNNQMKGAYNAVAPEKIKHKQFIRTIAKHLDKKLWLPNIPAFVVKMIFGLMADILLYGNHCSSQKIEQAGFSFKYRNFNEAVKSLF